MHRDGISVLDFEGEPARPLAERRGKVSPLRDVAGMLRSLHYASVAARMLPSPRPDAELPAASALAAWHAQAHEAFLGAYLAAHHRPTLEERDSQERLPSGESFAGLLPDPEFFTALLDALLLEKAAYELRYEAQNRPDWAIIPLQGLMSLLPDAP
jgi:maltose alpha-D-glucosyltransferase / alpha-amylase